MTKEEIYEHLAKVYLGKKRKKKKKKSPLMKALFFGNALLLILLLSFALTKSLPTTKRKIRVKENLLSLALGNYPLRLSYRFDKDTPQVQNFSMHLPNIDLVDYDFLIFSIRGFEDSIPNILKIGLENKKKERAYIHFKEITQEWKKVEIPLKEFKEITDWSDVIKLSFVFEAWNLNKQKYKVLIDDVSFSSRR